MATRPSKLSIILGVNAKAFNAGLNKASRAFSRFGSSMSSAGASLTRSVGAPLGALAGIAGKAAVDFEFAIAKVAAVSGATASDMKLLEEEAKRLGRTTAFSASDVAGLQLELSKLGFNPGQIDAMDSSILALSQAFDNELGETAEATGVTLRAFGLKATETGRVADVMATAFGNSALDLSRFSESMGKVAPIARDAGLGLEDTTAILGILANNGITGADAGTKLKIALTEIRAAGLDVDDTLKAIADGSFTFEDALGTLGKRAQILAPILGGNSEELAEFRDKLGDSEGAALAAQGVLDDTTQGALFRMQSALEGLAIAFGELLLPKIERMTNVVSNLAARFTALDDGTKETILNVAGLASAAGPALFLFGKLSSVIGGLLGVLGGLSAPVIAIAAAIAGAAYLIYENWDELVRYFTEGPGTAFLQAVLDAVNSFVGFVVNLFARIYEFAIAIWNEFGDDIVAAALAFLDFLVNQFETLFSFLGNIFDAGTSFLSGNWEDGLKFLADAALDAVRFILGAFLQLFEGVGRGVDALAEFFGFENVDVAGFVEDASTALDGFLEGLKFNEQGEDAGTDFISGVQGSFDGFSGFSFGGLTASTQTGDAGSVTIDGADAETPSFLESGDGDAGMNSLTESIDSSTQAFQAMGEAGSAALNSIGGAIADAIVDGDNLGESLKEIGKSLLKNLISISVGYLITNALSPLAPENIATAGTAGIAKAGAAPGLVASLFGGLQFFARGGAVTGPTLAMIGENAASRGEFVIPFERMGEFLGQVGIESGPDRIGGRLQSGDIFLSNEKTDRLLSRRRIL